MCSIVQQQKLPTPLVLRTGMDIVIPFPMVNNNKIPLSEREMYCPCEGCFENVPPSGIMNNFLFSSSFDDLSVAIGSNR